MNEYETAKAVVSEQEGEAYCAAASIEEAREIITTAILRRLSRERRRHDAAEEVLSSRVEILKAKNRHLRTELGAARDKLTRTEGQLLRLMARTEPSEITLEEMRMAAQTSAAPNETESE